MIQEIRHDGAFVSLSQLFRVSAIVLRLLVLNEAIVAIKLLDNDWLGLMALLLRGRSL